MILRFQSDIYYLLNCDSNLLNSYSHWKKKGTKAFTAKQCAFQMLIKSKKYVWLVKHDFRFLIIRIINYSTDIFRH